MKKRIKFCLEFIKNTKEVGAIFPSSKSLSKNITKYLKEDKNEKRVILEVGAGTGSFTEEIIASLKKEDTFYIIELNPIFCKLLKEKIELLNKNEAKIILIENNIETYKFKEKFNYIISGVPFNNFEAKFTIKILNKYKELLKKEGVLSYFEYTGVSNINSVSKKINFHHIKNKKINKNIIEKKIIYNNFPPATILYIRF